MPDFWLALGGGAARGIAHIGVIRALEELNRTPVEVSGTSMGAIIAALYTLGKTSHEMEEIVRKTRIISLVDWDGKTGLLKGNKLLKFFEEITESKTFADTKIPLKILATSLTTGKQVIFSHGSIALALRASVSLPGIFTPHQHNEELLIDGGVLNNLPIECLNSRRVIAVSALPHESTPLITRRKIFGISVPKTLFTTSYWLLQNTLQIMLRANENASLKTNKDICCIQPDYTGLNMHEFHRYRELIERGYANKEKIQRWI